VGWVYLVSLFGISELIPEKSRTKLDGELADRVPSFRQWTLPFSSDVLQG
jgi:hypothetical protein